MITSDGGKAVIAGNERVLRARLADGRFYWDQDRKKPLSEWAEGLKGVTFHAKIGTIAEKVERVTSLALTAASSLRGATATKQSSLDRHAPNGAHDDEAFYVLVKRAAELCKADLVTGMVGEFPELQGVMGRYYALQQKEDAAVADAIRDHYLPLGPDSPVPTAPVSACVALADKFDTLISMFAAGEKPTGSKDPFALRRSALGIIRIILENNLRLPLKAFLNDELVAFFSDRLKVMLKDQGIRHDIINAVMANGDDDLVRVVARAKALQEFLATENGVNLLAGYKRASNIVAAEEKKDKTTYSAFGLTELNSAALKEPEEIKLKDALVALHDKIQPVLQKEDFNQAMQILASLRPVIDAFFDKTLVNADDKAVRLARLRLLSSIKTGVNNIADFSQIEG
jgi:glycyl-tRNA synthetase beta chain